MPPFPFVLEKTAQKIIDITLSPTRNVFESMLLIITGDGEPGIHEWVNKVRSDMTKRELENHKLALIGFFYVLFPDEGQITFPAYLNNLEQTDATVLRDKMLNAYASIKKKDQSDVDWEKVLVSSESYVNFLVAQFEDKDKYLDVKIEKRAYDYVIDPPAMKDFLIGHLTWAWKKYFEPEWRRVEPMLLESVRSFKNFDLLKMTRLEAANFIIGQDVSNSKWCQHIDDVERVEFIPNPHIGPYVHASPADGTLYILFRARQPEEAVDRIPDLDRTEIVARLSALADDTRLHILQLVAERGEIRVQDILEEINLSQPSVSRYLSQLSATGYLQERRESGAKVYSLNKERIDKTLKAVNAFLLGR